MRRAVGLAVLTLAVAVVLLPTAAAIPEPASPVGKAWRDLFMKVTWAALVVGVVVEGLLVYALIRFRARKGGPKEGPHIHGNTRMEIAWTIAPTVVMAWLLVISYQGLFAVDEHPDSPIDFTVNVHAFRFDWEFTYPDGSTSGHDLRVEQNRVVGLDVTAQDVIHAFGSPGLAIMIDAVPGRVNHFWFQATEAGEYPVHCRELCGVGHSRMNGTIYVFPEGSEGDRHWGFAPAPAPANTTVPPAENTTAPAGNNTTAPPSGRAIPVTLKALAPGGIDPAKIQVAKGEAVTFTVTNTDSTKHNLYIGPKRDPSQPNNGALWHSKPDVPKGGGTDQFSVAFEDKDATFAYWCDISGHWDLGMRGELTVGMGAAVAGGKEPILPGFEPVLVVGALVGAVLLLRRRKA